jgi:hypothetical protein
VTRPRVLFFEPLFEEANRTRRLIAQIRHMLLSGGIDSEIAEPPGTGESLTPIEAVSFADWLAYANGCNGYTVIASIRGGALLDHAASAPGYWRFSPETGARLVRDLDRARLGNADGSMLYAGHKVQPSLIDVLKSASPQPVSPLRVVRLESDTGDADLKLPGSPLWRRAEPGEDFALASALATDLANWVSQCAA